MVPTIGQSKSRKILEARIRQALDYIGSIRRSVSYPVSLCPVPPGLPCLSCPLVSHHPYKQKHRHCQCPGQFCMTAQVFDAINEVILWEKWAAWIKSWSPEGHRTQSFWKEQTDSPTVPPCRPPTHRASTGWWAAAEAGMEVRL